MSKFTPQVRITLGDRDYLLKCGFGTVAEFERIYPTPFFASFKDGINVRAIVVLLIIGLKHQRKFSEKQITDIFDEYPEQFAEIANVALPFMVQKMMPESVEDEDEDDPEGVGPLDVIEGEISHPAPSTGEAS